MIRVTSRRGGPSVGINFRMWPGKYTHNMPWLVARRRHALGSWSGELGRPTGEIMHSSVQQTLNLIPPASVVNRACIL